jgi:CubicO group peptidase (beta-lactamase class C family)
MQGSPPAPDKVIRFANGSSRQFPQLRWSFSHARELHPTLDIPRGDGPASCLPQALRDDLDDVTFTPLGAIRPMSFAQSLKANYTDGIVVLHRGRVVMERYFGALNAQRPHIAFSVTKSFIGSLGALLVAEGVLDELRPVAHWVPELAASGFGTATLGEVMDMTTGLDFSEVYTDPASGIAAYARSGGFAPPHPDHPGADGLYAFLQTVAPAGAHGQAFCYRSINTDVLAWVIQRATGQRVEALLAQRLWAPMGAERDAHITCDPHGMPFAAGGLCTTLRDLARMGEMMRCDGAFNGQQVVPARAVAAIRASVPAVSPPSSPKPATACCRAGATATSGGTATTPTACSWPAASTARPSSSTRVQRWWWRGMPRIRWQPMPIWTRPRCRRGRRWRST